MPKKTNDDLRSMSINNLVRYTSEHPKEGARTSTVLGKAASECLGMYIDDKVMSAKKILTPPQLETAPKS